VHAVFAGVDSDFGGVLQERLFAQRRAIVIDDGRFDAVIEANSKAHAQLRGALLCIAILSQRDFSRPGFDIRVHDAPRSCDPY
jgi:hypothetical protein